MEPIYIAAILNIGCAILYQNGNVVEEMLNNQKVIGERDLFRHPITVSLRWIQSAGKTRAVRCDERSGFYPGACGYT